MSLAQAEEQLAALGQELESLELAVAALAAAPAAAPVAAPTAAAPPAAAAAAAPDAVPFFCHSSTTCLAGSPTAEERAALGGVVTAEGFVFADGHTERSPTGACKHVLNRAGATNEWQGPKHVYILIGTVWTRYDNAVKNGLILNWRRY